MPTRRRKRRWRTVPDRTVRHRWDRDCECTDADKSVYVDPAFYADNGTPGCAECGNDRIYVRTEVQR